MQTFLNHRGTKHQGKLSTSALVTVVHLLYALLGTYHILHLMQCYQDTRYVIIRSTCTMIIVPQDPKEADPMMRVQNDLDETKIVLVSLIIHVWREKYKL